MDRAAFKSDTFTVKLFERKVLSVRDLPSIMRRSLAPSKGSAAHNSKGIMQAFLTCIAIGVVMFNWKYYGKVSNSSVPPRDTLVEDSPKIDHARTAISVSTTNQSNGNISFLLTLVKH